MDEKVLWQAGKNYTWTWNDDVLFNDCKKMCFLTDMYILNSQWSSELF